MHIRLRKSWISAAAVAGSLAGMAPAAALDGETSLNLKTQACKIEGEGMVCKGLGGWKIAIGGHGLNPTIALVPPGKSQGDGYIGPLDERDVRIFQLGPPDRAYWRGISVAIPIAILSRAENDKLVETGGALPRAENSKAAVLAVFRLGPEGVCTVAYVPGQNPRDTGLAGEAMAYAQAARCPVKSIRLFGKVPPALASYWRE